MLRPLLFYVLFAQISLAQTQLVFHPSCGSAKLSDEVHMNNDTLHFETLRFYVSNVQVFNKGRIAWKEKNSHHLVDASSEKSLVVKLMLPTSVTYDEIRFCLGIDSATNVSGAMGGDLDPTKGMYWTWQSGYVNLKLEGSSNVCQTRNRAFEFHLGGYAAPFASIQTITLACSPAKTQNIYVDVAQFISRIDLAKENQVMSPGEKAVELSKKAAKMFSMTQP